MTNILYSKLTEKNYTMFNFSKAGFEQHWRTETWIDIQKDSGTSSSSDQPTPLLTSWWQQVKGKDHFLLYLYKEAHNEDLRIPLGFYLTLRWKLSILCSFSIRLEVQYLVREGQGTVSS